MSVQVCPGCQGRNLPEAATCEWCGRPFDGRSSGFALRWWHLATALLFGFVVVATLSLVFLSANRLPTLSDFRPKPAASPTVRIEPTQLPTRAATPGQTLATPIPAPSPAAAAPPPPSPTAVPPRFARIVNTNGLGVFLREEPGAQGNRIQPAIAEGAIVKLVGPEQAVQAQTWRLCEVEGRGVQGWAPAQYLLQVDVAPTPVRP